ncbi:MAG: substrate-binding domain-containing protein [Anaerolineales bacterium]|nr:substrate-binding domain-containing protein [Anaerolineales bacterium]
MDIYNRLRIDMRTGIPLAVQISQQITWLIASGAVRAGDQLPPMREMADALGINMHTVRAAYQRLEADLLVSIRTRKGTIVLPFQPGELVGARPDLPSFLFGVILPTPAPIYIPYLEGIQDAAGEARLLPLICFARDNPHLTDRYLQQLLAKRVDGIIVTSTSSLRFVDEPSLVDAFPPIVFVDTPDIPGSLLPDSKDAAYLAVGHLLQHGYPQIGLIACPRDWANVEPCWQGYEQALAEAGLKPDPDLIVEVPDFSHQSGYEGAMTLLQRKRLPRAVFIIADSLALGAMQAFADAGLDIPADIALASYNNIERAALHRPGLTTATLPAYDMGVIAVQMLQKRMEGHPPWQEHEFVLSELIIRESCGCGPIVKRKERRAS